ncbi:hypothetical protein PFISCL1PPCAC_23806, partial [Pristionchus fissidentatus]
ASKATADVPSPVAVPQYSPFVCETCGRAFGSEIALRAHRPYHSAHKCDLCGKGMSSKDRLDKHKASFHPGGIRRIKIPEPTKEKAATSSNSATAVNDESNGNQPSTSCTAKGRNRLKKRKRKQNDNFDKKPKKGLKCMKCGKAFAQSQSLEVHMLRHEGIRPFVCNAGDCRVDFYCDADLKKHQRIVHNLLPYSCASCEMKFAIRKELTQHNLICAAAAAAA